MDYKIALNFPSLSFCFSYVIVGAVSSRDLNGFESTYIRGWKPLPPPASVKLMRFKIIKGGLRKMNETKRLIWHIAIVWGVVLSCFLTLDMAVAQQSDKKPNILVIFGDDVGMWNVGAYTHGMMGRTPNIDRIAKEGMLFTDHYAHPSCTAGRAAFITGQARPSSPDRCRSARE
jgi:hypothetical protein